MGHIDMGTDARVFYIALLSLQSRRQNNLNGLVKQLAYRMHSLLAYCPHYWPTYTPQQSLTPNPSPRGEGSSMLCFYSFTL